MLKNIFILLLTLWSISANAGLITYIYTGSITSLYEADCIQNSRGGCDGYNINYQDSSTRYENYILSTGDTFTGSFTYDTQAILSGVSSDGYQSIYLDGVISQSFRLSTYSAPSNALPGGTDGNLSIVDGRYGTDVFQTSSYYSNADYFSGATISLQDNTNTIFQDMNIPNLLDPNSFSYRGFSLFFLQRSNNNQLQLRGNINTLALSKVSEPATIWLFGFIFLGLIISKSIRKEQIVVAHVSGARPH